MNMDGAQNHFLVPNLAYQGLRASSDPGPLNKIEGDQHDHDDHQKRSRSRNESMTENDNDGACSNCNDKTER